MRLAYPHGPTLRREAKQLDDGEEERRPSRFSACKSAVGHTVPNTLRSLRCNDGLDPGDGRLSALPCCAVHSAEGGDTSLWNRTDFKFRPSSSFASFPRELVKVVECLVVHGVCVAEKTMRIFRKGVVLCVCVSRPRTVHCTVTALSQSQSHTVTLPQSHNVGFSTLPSFRLDDASPKA